MKLTIEAFRGVREPVELKFRPNNKLTIIYGDNGSGKTTVADALEFLFNGTCGSLEEKSLDGRTRFPTLVHAQKTASDLRVAWEEKGKRFEARLINRKPLQTGDRPPTKLRTLQRKAIVSLIEETPAKRFARLQSFVSVPALEREEESLRRVIKANKASLETRKAIAIRAREELGRLHAENTAETDPDTTSTLADWIASVASERDDTRKENLEILSDLKREILGLQDEFKPLGAAFQNLASTAAKRQGEAAALQKLAADQAGNLASALGLLAEAETFLAGEKVEACPLCDTPQPGDELKTRVSEKLASLQTLRSQDKKLTAAGKAFDTATTVLDTLRKGVFNRIGKIRQTRTAAVDADQWAVPPLAAPLSAPAQPGDITADWFAELSAEVGSLTALRTWVEDEVDTLTSRQSLKERVLALVKDTTEAEAELDTLAGLIKKAEVVRKVLQEERTRHANASFKSISDDFARLYATIHPGEEIEKVKLYLDPKRRGSAKLDGELFGMEGAPPVAYLSESHLDTLGLCLFIALEKLDAPGATVLFLDDAIASVDEAHMARLYDMIATEAEHFKHIILTSHYQPLRFKFKWGRLARQNIDFVELAPWTIDGGIVFSRGPGSGIGELRTHLAEGENSIAIAATAGIVLEYLLDFLTGIYRCKLPRIPGAEQRWTLGDYKAGLESGKRKLLNALACEHLDAEGQIEQTVPLAPLLEAVFAQLESRNTFGAHLKEIAAQFDSLKEATALGKASMALVEALCDADHQLPDRKKDGMCWANRGAKVTRQLYPLEPPQ